MGTTTYQTVQGHRIANGTRIVTLEVNRSRRMNMVTYKRFAGTSKTIRQLRKRSHHVKYYLYDRRHLIILIRRYRLRVNRNNTRHDVYDTNRHRTLTHASVSKMTRTFRARTIDLYDGKIIV